MASTDFSLRPHEANLRWARQKVERNFECLGIFVAVLGRNFQSVFDLKRKKKNMSWVCLALHMLKVATFMNRIWD